MDPPESSVLSIAMFVLAATLILLWVLGLLAQLVHQVLGLWQCSSILCSKWSWSNCCELRPAATKWHSDAIETRQVCASTMSHLSCLNFDTMVHAPFHLELAYLVLQYSACSWSIMTWAICFSSSCWHDRGVPCKHYIHHSQHCRRLHSLQVQNTTSNRVGYVQVRQGWCWSIVVASTCMSGGDRTL
jgi:hypothetical protein